MTGSSRSTPYNGIYDRVCTELSRKNRMAALAHIFGKLKGKPPQQVDFNNVSRDLASRSDDELRYHIDHGRWPESSEEQAPASKPGGTA